MSALLFGKGAHAWGDCGNFLYRGGASGGKAVCNPDSADAFSPLSGTETDEAEETNRGGKYRFCRTAVFSPLSEKFFICNRFENKKKSLFQMTKGLFSFNQTAKLFFYGIRFFYGSFVLRRFGNFFVIGF